MNIKIGTAQWGLDYGVTNNNGKVTEKEVEKIMKYIYKMGINELDTAKEYGQAEKVIGKYGKNRFKISTKIKIKDKSYQEILSDIRESKRRCNVNVLECVLIHDQENIKRESSEAINEAFRIAKEEKWILKSGASIYESADAVRCMELLTMDRIQVPYNALDRRMIADGTLKKLKESEVEVEGRSIFLQGILLKKVNDLPNYFKRYESTLKEWEEYVTKNKLTMIEAAIMAVRENKLIDTVVLGAETKEQIEEFIKYSKAEREKISFKSTISTEEGLVDPRKWR